MLPGEIYCHSLTDPSILGDAPAGTHTLTYFGLHTPGRALRRRPRGRQGSSRSRARSRRSTSTWSSRSSPAWPATPTADPCLEAKIPQDVERDLAMPGGHIFHGDLEWPWAPNRARLDTPAQQWGVQTDVASVLVCGSGSRRGGAVSGLGGHNAAQAVLASLLSRLRAPSIFLDGHPLVTFTSLHQHAPLAQLAEQLTLNQRVRGSSP